MLLWLQHLFCPAIIAYIEYLLSRHGDIIAAWPAFPPRKRIKLEFNWVSLMPFMLRRLSIWRLCSHAH